MAKEKPKELEPLETETVYYLKEIIEGWAYKGHWIIYSKTKYGDKWFMNYESKERALSAAKSHNLTLLSDQLEV